MSDEEFELDGYDNGDEGDGEYELQPMALVVRDFLYDLAEDRDGLMKRWTERRRGDRGHVFDEWFDARFSDDEVKRQARHLLDAASFGEIKQYAAPNPGPEVWIVIWIVR